ncbi:glucosaminidase domain-containing protein [Dubosiella newyorkensis]|jgi:beta-N-acetylglucosaminidase|uniref:glucosaminidase domain-containing protein n=1 Tax=Dubosiella newyorkensis TaxID=1862672 RepID=UPI002353ADA3|nr:glucosaminidase domain-containing protein [Dubosiella newyorkensis]MCI9040718.1 glucosaminidase domain-containing protein [Dubosiella newyorkensis]
MQKKPKRKIRKQIWIPALFLLLILVAYLGFKITENGVFTVIDYKEDPQEVATYKHFEFAKRKMKAIDHEQVCIKNEKGKVVAIKEGLVNFHTKDASENTEYTMENGENGYLNGNYGSDGLYLDTSQDGKQVLFQMAGVKGWVDVDSIDLLLYDPNYTLSSYTKNKDTLVHQVCLNLLENEAISYGIGPVPPFMEDDTTYYSYDGHYFYTDFKSMSQDVQHNEHANAINQEPYFNFYQYVPHRSKSHAASDRFNTFLWEQKGIDQLASAYPCLENESVLYDQQPLFMAVQDQVYMNGTMMFALACNESGYGQSQYAIEQHNVFGHEAYDSNPDQATLYADLNDCVEQHAQHFLQEGYANPNDWRYHGSWFGDKGSGINVQYASDPYWGEKAASMYYYLDEGKDASSISIVTKLLDQKLSVEDKKGNVLYSYPEGSVASFIVLEENGNTIKVQLEAPIQDGKIDVSIPYTENMVGYVSL